MAAEHLPSVRQREPSPLLLGPAIRFKQRPTAPTSNPGRKQIGIWVFLRLLFRCPLAMRLAPPALTERKYF